MMENVLPSHQAVDLGPGRFNAIVQLIRSIDQSKIDAVEEFDKSLGPFLEELETISSELYKADVAIGEEIKRTMKQKVNPLDSIKKIQETTADYDHLLNGQHFVHVATSIFFSIGQGFDYLSGLCRAIKPGVLMLTEKGFEKIPEEIQELQGIVYQIQLNKPTIDRFIHAMLAVHELKHQICVRTVQVAQGLSAYHGMLVHRHSVDGVKIFESPLVTDVAISVLDNVDSHGEIEDGRKPDEISTYSFNKARLVADAILDGKVNTYITNPDRFTEDLLKTLEMLWVSACNLYDLFEGTVRDLHLVLNIRPSVMYPSTEHDFESLKGQISDLNPNAVVWKEGTTLFSREERYNESFRNETIETIAKALVNAPKGKMGSSDLISYILNRKAELRDYFQNENSFYVCKIGAGNPFTGLAPGALEIIPGERPVAHLDEVIGAGFDSVKEFMKEIESAAKWHDLFVATSPSRTADKSNVLLIGPQGCGKSEILRGVGSDTGSISIFAQGSDFLTCWKGEAEKNPKRLFEGGVRLQKEANKHVHFLIDEVDEVLHDSRNPMETNLTLEFQVLLDGVVHYPNLSLWGATNNPWRIPMPMIRRFNKVAIVGELNKEQRIQLLKQFTAFMPNKGITAKHWEQFSNRLRGATGDVIRKVLDHAWREKMTDLVQRRPELAEELVKSLNDGVKFDIAEFGASQRRSLHRKLIQNGCCIQAKDIESAIEITISNVAIKKEISVAVDTYARAKDYLAGEFKTAVGFGQ